MKQEEKDLLLRDLCSRLPYGVICQMEDKLIINDSSFYNYTLSERHIELFRKHKGFYILPYLRPMSSMTEEEKEELIKNFWGSHTAKDTFEELSWYLSKHFDVNGLIPKGLAIEVTEDNNPYKE